MSSPSTNGDTVASVEELGSNVLSIAACMCPLIHRINGCSLGTELGIPVSGTVND